MIKLPFRQIHLDFHTSPLIPEVGAQWDPQAFGDMLDEACVNSITLFAKCHHGHLYYDTKHPARHPTLKPGFDLLGEQLEVCRSRGIRAPIYLSVQCDEYVAMTEPGWRVVGADGKFAGGPLEAAWHIVDMSSPYVDYLADQIAEVMKKYKPVDEIFLDMCWDQPSCSTWALRGMTNAGLDPLRDEDRNKYARLVTHGYMESYNKLIADHNRGRMIPVWYNSRPKVCLPQEAKFLQHIEIEALPTGFWGYSFFPINIRFARNFGLPVVGMTGRFHKSWADFGGLKPRAALMYECAQMLAHGAGCSVGDQMHPDGTIDKAVYQLIGSVYQHVEKCEPWCIDAKPVTEIAVLRDVNTGYTIPAGGDEEGTMRSLQQLGQQFDFLPALPQTDLEKYKVLVVPAGIKLKDGLIKLVRAFLRRGGALLIEAPAAIDAEGKLLLPELGIATHGPSPYTTTYLRFDKSVGEPAGPSTAVTDHVLYEKTFRITASRGGAVLAKIAEPYFERHWDHFSSHYQTPSEKVSKFAAAVQTGRMVTFAGPIFRAYGTHGNLSYRHLIKAALDRLLPSPLTRHGGPGHLEVTLTRQSKPARTIAHVLSFVPSRRTPTLDIVEDPFPVVDVPLSVRLDTKPTQITQHPDGKPLAFEYRDGYAHLRLTSLDGHTMVVFE